MYKIIKASLPALAAAAFAGEAGAAAFQLLEQNASSLGNAYAGTAAVAENASTIFFNPAGMTKLNAHEYSVGVNFIKPSYTFTNANSNVGALANTGNGGNGGHLGVVPNAYFSWGINKDLYVGLGISAPFGLKTEYDDAWIGAAQSRKFEIKTINFNPSVAYRINDAISVGAGVNYQKLDAQYIRTAGVLAAPFPLSTSTVNLQLSDSAWGWNVGVLLNPTPDTRIGIAYRSAIAYQATGTVDVTGPSAAFNASRNGTADATIKLPATLTFSLAHQANERLQILGDLAWTGWNSIPKVDIYTSASGPNVPGQTLDTSFHNTWRAALGVTYALNDAMKLKAGIAYDQTPVPDAAHRMVSLPDNDRTWFSVGGQWKPTRSSAVDLGLAYLYMPDSTVNNNQLASARGLVNGSYSGSVWILGAQYSNSF